jgi:plasmid maintenance system antidote protein VapI
MAICQASEEEDAIAFGLMVTDLIKGTLSITPDITERFAHFFGNEPEFWADLSAN